MAIKCCETASGAWISTIRSELAVGDVTCASSHVLLQVEEMLPTYRELYDIVLVGDGDMSVITALLQEILQ